MQYGWYAAGRAAAVAAFVVVSTGISPGVGSGPVHGQTGPAGVTGGSSWRHCADDGRMRWGAATWSRGVRTVQCVPSAGLSLTARHALLARLEDREGGRVYIEVEGPGPAEVIIERKPRRDVYLRITPDNGHSRGDVQVRSSRSDDVPLIFVANNRQERLVVEAPDWLHWITVVVNGVVLHDAASLSR